MPLASTPFSVQGGIISLVAPYTTIASFQANHAKFIATQTTAPTCLDNCGAAGAAVVTGSDAAMRIVLGSTLNSGQPSFAVKFNGTYLGTNPACFAFLANAGTATATSAPSTATGVTVNTSSAPSNAQQYNIFCPGLSG